jgi:hypothetical protein
MGRNRVKKIREPPGTRCQIVHCSALLPKKAYTGAGRIRNWPGDRTELFY